MLGNSTSPMIIAQTADAIGGDNAVSRVNEAYTGGCEVVTCNDETIAILPNYIEARAVAAYAITSDGGYGSVIVVEAPGKQITHSSFNDWL
ncbi:MAG: hypothetical protein H6998_20845 [Hahellaceae bacterium]|nr:hypothetical protein [Hahellaceae bacterium]